MEFGAPWIFTVSPNHPNDALDDFAESLVMEGITNVHITHKNGGVRNPEAEGNPDNKHGFMVKEGVKIEDGVLSEKNAEAANKTADTEESTAQPEIEKEPAAEAGSVDGKKKRKFTKNGVVEAESKPKEKTPKELNEERDLGQSKQYEDRKTDIISNGVESSTRKDTDNDDEVFQAVGKPIKVVYRVVDSSNIISSFDDGAIDSLQGRQKGASESRLSDIITGGFQSEKLGINNDINSGAPLVTRNGYAINNGRVGVVNILTGENRKKYNAFLEGQGFDISGIKNPILVRVMTERISLDSASEIAAGEDTKYNREERADIDESLIDEENDNEPDNESVDGVSKGSLERVSTDEIQETDGPGTGGVEQGALSGSATDSGPDGLAGRGGAAILHGVGTDQGGISAAEAGGRSDGTVRRGGITGDTQNIDFTITEDLDLGVGGLKTKFKGNIAAIKMLKERKRLTNDGVAH